MHIAATATIMSFSEIPIHLPFLISASVFYVVDIKCCSQADNEFNTLWENHIILKSCLISENIELVCTKFIT